MKEKIITNFELIEIFENEPRISHRLLANKTNNKVLSVQKLITENTQELEEFGHLRFKIKTVKNSVGAINQQKTFYLNEQQATLVLTFMRNSEIVKNIKIKLVKEFFRMREILKSQPVQTPQSLENIDLDLQISQNKKLLEFIELITSQTPKNLFFLDKIYKHLSEKSPLNLFGIDLNSYYFIPTELGKFLNKSAVEINKILEHKGLQFKEDGKWFLTKKGENFGFEFENGKFKTIKWKLETIL